MNKNSKSAKSAKFAKSAKSAKFAKSAKTSKKSSDSFVDDDVVSDSGSYFKPEGGDSKVRLISKPISGWLAWDEDEEGNKKQKRTPLNDKLNRRNKNNATSPKKSMA